MSSRYESNFIGHKSSELFFQAWTNEVPRGTIVVTHGLAEHSDCYDAFAQELMKDNWNVLAWDLRGHGRSSGKRGFVEEFSDMDNDLNAFAKVLQDQPKPHALFGHSMGGLIALRYLINFDSHDFKGLCLSSPALGLAVRVPKIKEQVARMAAQWAPRLTLYNEIRYRDLTRDEEHLKTYEHDTLRHERISPCLYIGMTDSFNFVLENADRIKLPTLMQLAGHDRIVSTPAAEKVFTKLGSRKKKKIIYPDSLHEIFNDLNRMQAFSDLRKFLNELN